MCKMYSHSKVGYVEISLFFQKQDGGALDTQVAENRTTLQRTSLLKRNDARGSDDIVGTIRPISHKLSSRN